MYGNTLLPPQSQPGYLEPGAELMLRDEWHLAAHCSYCPETVASGLPGVWISPKPSVLFLMRPWDSYSDWRRPPEVPTPKSD